jgi:hypothetical protein
MCRTPHPVLCQRGLYLGMVKLEHHLNSVSSKDAITRLTLSRRNCERHDDIYRFVFVGALVSAGTNPCGPITAYGAISRLT